MSRKEITYQLLEYNQLSTQEKELVSQAEGALQFSYSPYSNFKVASAVLLVDNSIIAGSNQENAAYPSGLCAERVALFAAKGSRNTDIDTIVVIAQNSGNGMADAFSCGSCRQVMVEYASQQGLPIKILMRTSHGKFISVGDVRELLPFHFEAGNLR